MKLDLQKWNAERIALETEIKALKHSIRREDKPVLEYRCTGTTDLGGSKYGWVPSGATYRGGTWKEYDSLHDLKRRATALYCLRAVLRKRHHPGGISDEDALKLLPRYALPEAA